MNNTFEYCFNKEFEEIDERLFDLTLIEDKNNNSNKSLASVDISFSSEEESDSSSTSKKTVSLKTVHQKQQHSNNNKKNSRKNTTKPCKKDEVIINESDNDSIQSTSTTKNKKSNNSNQELTGENDKKQKSLYKTELCRNWEETNHCRYGMKCQYAHGAHDLREIDRHPKYKTQKCRTFHQTGSCPYGARCTFRHFNLPGDALEMKNLDRQEKEEEEERKRQQQEQEQVKEKELLLLQQKQQQQQQKEQQQQQKEVERSSIFSMDNQKLLQQNWFLNSNSNLSPIANLGNHSTTYKLINNNMFDPEDSLLPSNAESLLPHELLFDLESPDDEEEKPARCPLRDYVNLPSFSSFQVPYHSQYMQPQQHQQHQQQHQQEQCKTFFRPWLF